MIKAIQKGFTLIELAIVIAILGILAAVALNNLGNTQASAECSMIKDMASKIASGAGVYTAAEGSTPSGMNLFITTAQPPFLAPAGAAPNRTNFNLSTFSFGTNSRKGSPCGAATAGNAGTLTCTNTFSNYTPVVYTYNSGAVTFVATPANNSQPCQ